MKDTDAVNSPVWFAFFLSEQRRLEGHNFSP